MAVVDDVLFALMCMVVGGTLTGVWLMTHGYRKQQATRIVVAAKKVDNRVMPNYSRAQRRSWKRRDRSH
jgi:hypothetical protein